MNEIKRIIKETTKNGMGREVRIAEINALLHGGYEPNERELAVLTDLVLYEELSDSRPDKMTLEEYPIMSEYQLARRQSGKHRKKAKGTDLPTRMEVPLSWAENYSNDGRNYSYPVKRKRDDYENEWVDEMSRSRNKERCEKYNAFVNGKVVRGTNGRFKREYSKGLFTVDIATGVKVIHEEDSDGRT